MSIYIGKDYSAMQGPCDSGYHVPTKDDWTALFNIGVNLGIWSTTSGGTYFLQYLLLPLAGQLSRNEGTPRLQNDSTYYWSCSQWTSNDLAYALGWISDTDIRYNDASLKGIGNPIRPFKDTPVTPDSTWTALYSDKIYHNSTLGLISLSSDGSTWITISDKNLGATQVWNYGDTLSQNNCGNFYQRGNNYGFAFTGAISTSSTQVNAGSYGPGNYYSSSTFITYNNDWSSVTNANIRGGVTGVKPGEVKNIYLGEGKTTVLSDMQGPCPAGFHVPLKTEWQGLKIIMDGLGLTTKDDYINKLHMSLSGDIFRTGVLNEQGNSGYYWTSSLSNDYSGYAHAFAITSSSIRVALLASANGQPIRCFKDSFIVPTSSWTAITGTLGGAGIFWNQTDGLISITSDGTTGYTIMDKNLGATTVYNNGDTLTQANMGNFYQRGNNHGFSSVSNPSKTSTSQVNARTYGPGNYYTSDTFIVRSSSPYEWDSSNNKNLRGGVSQGTSTIVNPGIKEVYIGTTKVYPKE